MDNEEKKPNDFGELKSLIQNYLADGVPAEELLKAFEECLGKKDEDEEKAEGEKAFGMKFIE